MISPEEEMRLYSLLEDKLVDLDVSLFAVSCSLARAWTDYLSTLGIRRERMGFVPEEDVYMSADPLHTTKYRLLIPWAVVEKILFVGLP
jgi:hypothetical protein